MDQKQQKMQKNAKTAAAARQAGANANNQYETAGELGNQDQANATTFQQAKKQTEQRNANRSNRNS